MQQQIKKGLADNDHANDSHSNLTKSRRNNWSGAAGQRATYFSNQNAVNRSSVKPSINKKKHHNTAESEVTTKEKHYQKKSRNTNWQADKPDEIHYIKVFKGKEMIISKDLVGQLADASDDKVVVPSCSLLSMSKLEQSFPRMMKI